MGQATADGYGIRNTQYDSKMVFYLGIGGTR
jgi:hypothetical protein